MSAELLDTAAAALGPLLSEVVFLGGASIHLWLSDPAAPAARATDDVDVISAITTRADYYRLGERLRERGFSEASDSRVICRWRHVDTGLLLDVMPQEQSVLGRVATRLRNEDPGSHAAMHNRHQACSLERSRRRRHASQP